MQDSQCSALAFALYANETAIHNIWGNQARPLTKPC